MHAPIQRGRLAVGHRLSFTVPVLRTYAMSILQSSVVYLILLDLVFIIYFIFYIHICLCISVSISFLRFPASIVLSLQYSVLTKNRTICQFTRLRPPVPTLQLTTTILGRGTQKRRKPVGAHEHEWSRPISFSLSLVLAVLSYLSIPVFIPWMSSEDLAWV